MKDQFQFKQFTIHHDRCAMKVGTDGVLLGAWGAVMPPRILDIGTGTGLIALMAAQRQPDAQVLGIDIDGDAVEQARENVASSPFANRVCIRQQSLQELSGFQLQDSNFNAQHSTLNAQLSAQPEGTLDPSRTFNSQSSIPNSQFSTFNFQFSTFSSILCNPPFFEETLLPPDARRSQARHTPTLPFPVLIDAVSHLLMPDGTFSVILPTTAFDDFRHRCFAKKLICTRLCHVQTTPTKPPKRVLATFCLQSAATPPSSSELSSLPAQCDGPTTLILNHGTARSPEYAALTRDFYLW